MRQSLCAKLLLLLLLLSVLTLGFGVLMGVSALVERQVGRDLGASNAQRTATRTRPVVSFGSLGAVLISSFLISRELLRSLSDESAKLNSA